MIVAGERPDAFNVEICLPRERKILGIYRGAEFYRFNAISRGKVDELIRGFLQRSLAARHASIQAARRLADTQRS